MDIDRIRDHAIVSSLAGAPFLLVFGIAWLVASGLTYAVPAGAAPWMYVVVGIPAAGLAIAVERRFGFTPPIRNDPLTPLALQLLFVQVLAFPAILLVWDASPHYLPVAFAAVVGAHFLPFQWMYRTPIYGVLAFVVAVGPYVLAILMRREAMHWTGVLVGTSLIAGAVAAYRHAQRRWRSGAGRMEEGSQG